MNTHSSRAELIAALTEDLTPVRRVRPRDGMLLIAFATLVAGIGAIAIFEFWSGMLTGEASAFFWITNGLLLLLGAASSAALVTGALPRIGPRPNAPSWSFAMLCVLPAAAIIGLLTTGVGEAGHEHGGINDPAAAYCTIASLVAGLLVAIAAVLWLRRGAPVAIERSAWLTGLAAGSLGALAYGITCPLDGIAHVGLWHFAPVVIAAVAARLIVPPLIRW